MENYRKILEHRFNEMTQRTIELVVGSSRHMIREIVRSSIKQKKRS